MRAKAPLVTKLVALLGLFSALAVPATAKAPPDQYDLFTATDDRVRDRFTQLTWQRSALASLSQQEAAAECVRRGYRLPSYGELLTLVDETPHTVYVGSEAKPLALDVNAFPNAPGGTYWSATLSDDKRFAYVVEFETGTTSRVLVSSAVGLARCVK